MVGRLGLQERPKERPYALPARMLLHERESASLSEDNRRAGILKTEKAMGLIIPRSERLSERVKVETRKKLFQELREFYIDEGMSEHEANAMAWAKIRAMRFAN
jgi:hypothetical protein